MGEIVEQQIVKDPDPENTLKDVLHDIVARNGLDRKLVGFDVEPQEVVKLIYQAPD